VPIEETIVVTTVKIATDYRSLSLVSPKLSLGYKNGWWPQKWVMTTKMGDDLYTFQ